MGKHVLLTIPAIGAMAGGINFAYHTFADQVGWRRRSWPFMHGFNNTYKFMSQNTLKSQVSASDFEIGVADSSL
jgi:hypothetical protein